MRKARMWKPRDLSMVRGKGFRRTSDRRIIEGPAHPTGIHRKTATQRAILVKRRKSRTQADAARYRRFKKRLLQRYDTDEYNRREQLTNTQHFSHTGKIDSEGFRKHTTIKGIPYDRDLSPLQILANKVRQYAYQNEFTGWIRDSAKQNVFRWKRDDGQPRTTSGRKNITAYNFRKTQPVHSELTGK